MNRNLVILYLSQLSELLRHADEEIQTVIVNDINTATRSKNEGIEATIKQVDQLYIDLALFKEDCIKLTIAEFDGKYLD